VLSAVPAATEKENELFFEIHGQGRLRRIGLHEKISPLLR